MIALRWALGLVLVLAVAGKLRAFGAFRDGLAVFGLRQPIAPVAAGVIVAVEAVTAVAMFSSMSDLAVGVAASLLGVAFTGTQTYLLTAGGPSSCQCFGAREPVSWWTWGRAALVLVAGLVLLGTAA
ncbi:MauE/DoxX family redox-associated membrane protein [Sphaerisporangium fuscum]|uniref:MauE/DoxX family redox-associated membrane protein n=1 Tax=Sphaerisporangium fuscum TaxID=2835868 RepID=UPI001BDDC867|nr:MauE/DoxX family redox-associated membrane protein [Sphaerisporangium fuscum]